jgi:hypothetical protein
MTPLSGSLFAPDPGSELVASVGEVLSEIGGPS